MSYDNTNTGILYKNDRKNTDKHPDYTGSININGVDHWLSAWIKEGKKGKFMSLSIGAVKQAKQDQHIQDKSNGYQKQPEAMIYDPLSDTPFNDDIPW